MVSELGHSAEDHLVRRVGSSEGGPFILRWFRKLQPLRKDWSLTREARGDSSLDCQRASDIFEK